MALPARLEVEMVRCAGAGARFGLPVGTGPGDALRTRAVPRGSLRPGGAACKLVYEPSCQNVVTSRGPDKNTARRVPAR